MAIDGIPVGDTVRRSEVVRRFGGSLYAGIVPSNTSPTVMVYSDPAVGAAHGYNFDGWADGAFYYTGEGQVGDQVLAGGNKAILQHVSDGRSLHVFEAVPGPVARPKGGKHQRYCGEFALDEQEPYRKEEAPDKFGEMRSVIVFKLLPVGRVIDQLLQRPSEVPAPLSTVTRREVEANEVDFFNRRGTDAGPGERREAELMERLQEHLRSKGRDVCRFSIKVQGSSTEMWTDTFDASQGVLYEVKAMATRENMRMAVGQLTDYGRFIVGVQSRRVVMPVMPAVDLMHLAHVAGLGVAWPTGQGFVAADPGGREGEQKPL